MQRSEVGASGALESYLARLSDALARVPAGDRRDILLETRSHVAERTRRSPWRSVEDVLAELGPAEAYARQFLPEGETPPAPAPSSSPRADALLGIARLVTGGVRTLPLLFFVVSAYAIALLALCIAIGKISEPDHIGLWIAERADGRPRYNFGIFEHTPPGREVLGHGLTAILLGITAATHLTMSALLKWLVRRK